MFHKKRAICIIAFLTTCINCLPISLAKTGQNAKNIKQINRWLDKAEAFAQQFSEPSDKVYPYLRIGELKLGIKDVQGAKKAFHKAEVLVQQFAEPTDKAYAYLHLGELKLEATDIQGAKVAFQKSFQARKLVPETDTSDIFGKIQHFKNIGILFNQINEKSLSKKAFELAKNKAKNLYQITGNQYFMQRPYFEIADHYAQIGDIKSSEETVKQLKENFRTSLDYHKIIRGYFVIAEFQGQANQRQMMKETLSETVSMLDLTSGASRWEISRVIELCIKYNDLSGALAIADMVKSEHSSDESIPKHLDIYCKIVEEQSKAGNIRAAQSTIDKYIRSVANKLRLKERELFNTKEQAEKEYGQYQSSNNIEDIKALAEAGQDAREAEVRYAFRSGLEEKCERILIKAECFIVRHLAKKKSYAEAKVKINYCVKMIKSFSSDFEKEEAHVAIAHALVSIKDFNGADGVAKQIDDMYEKARVYSDIVAKQAGDIRHVRNYFRKAKQYAKMIEDEYYHDEIWFSLVKSQISINDIANATQTAFNIKDKNEKNLAYAEIIAAQLKMSNYQGLMRTILKISSADTKDEIYQDVIREQIKSNDYQSATNTAEKITNIDLMDEMYQEIIESHLESKEYQAAKNMALKITDADSKCSAYQEIIESQIKSGDYRNAKKTTETLLNFDCSYERYVTFAKIYIAMNDQKSFVKFVDELEDDTDKYDAYIGAAEQLIELKTGK